MAYTGEKRSWNNSLFGCFSPIGTCCMASFCPCILFGKTKYRVKHDGSLNGYSCCSCSCTLFCVANIMPCLKWRMIRSLRSDIRKAHGLTGGCCGDCFKAIYCECCALVQQEKEVIERTREREMMVGYQKNGGMQYTAQ